MSTKIAYSGSYSGSSGIPMFDVSGVDSETEWWGGFGPFNVSSGEWIIDVIKVDLYRVLTNTSPPAGGNIELELRSGSFSGDLIASSTYNRTSLPEEEHIFAEFTPLEEAQVESGVDYYLILKDPQGTYRVGAGLNEYDYTYWRANPATYVPTCYRHNSDAGWILSSTTRLIFEVWGDPPPPSKPTNPTPANEDIEADFSTLTISWTDGGDADTFDVYIGNTGDLTLVASAQVETSYTTNVSELATIFGAWPYNGKVYWRIDATNEGGTTTGDEWYFDPLPTINAISLGAGGSFIVAATNEGIFLSSNLGSTWINKLPDSQSDTSWTGCKCSSDGTYIVVWDSDGNIYRSANSGTSWASIDPADGDTYSPSDIAISSDGLNIIIVGTNSTDASESCYISTNYGVTWTAKKPISENIAWDDCDISDNGKVIGVSKASSSSFYVSFDSGSTWELQSIPATSSDRSKLGISGDGKLGIIANTLNNNEIFTNTGWYSKVSIAENTITSYIRSLMEDTTPAEARTTLEAQEQGEVLDDLNTLGAVTADGDFLVGSAEGIFAYESGNTARTSLGLGTSNSPTFTDLTLSSPSNIYALSHDSFAGFVADEHIAHSGITITAGNGLSGGGTIDGNISLAVDFSELTGETPTFVGLDLSGITDSNVPYMSASGFADSPISTDGTNVAIANPTGRCALTVVGNTHQGCLEVTTYRDSDSGSYFFGMSSRGTLASPENSQEDDIVFKFRGQGMCGGSFSTVGEILFLADGEFGTAGDTSDSPGRIELRTTPDGSDQTTVALTLDKTQNAIFAEGITAKTLTLSANAATSLKITNAQSMGVAIDLTDCTNGDAIHIGNNQFIKFGEHTGTSLTNILGVSTNDETSLLSFTGEDININPGAYTGIILKGNSGFIGINEKNPRTLLEITHAEPFVTLHNSSASDSDGSRFSGFYFRGHQSGNEETALGGIIFTHDGAADDQKGRCNIYTNNGTNGNSPTLAVIIDSSQGMDVVGDFTAGTIQADNGYTGSWVNAEGSTVTVVGGVITDVS